MSYKEYLADSFHVQVIMEGKYKGKICFKTPLANYTLNRADWEIVKEKLNEV